MLGSATLLEKIPGHVSTTLKINNWRAWPPLKGRGRARLQPGTAQLYNLLSLPIREGGLGFQNHLDTHYLNSDLEARDDMMYIVAIIKMGAI